MPGARVVNLCVPHVLWGRVLTGTGDELGPTRLSIQAGRITALEPSPQPPSDADLVVEHGWIAPGLIDLQVNGAGGVDLTSASDPERALSQVSSAVAAHGVTAFCPTLVSSPRQTILDRLPAFRPGCGASLGAHVEGPFIDPAHRGVHEPAVLRTPTAEEVAAWIEAGPPAIVTLAPELPGGLQAVAQLSAAGVVVSLGHSGADVSAAQAGLAAGARMGTHLFNAMPPLHHRAPGLVGALLASPSTRLGLIADGVHLDKLVVELVVRAAGPERVVLVSDALSAAGAPPGACSLGDQRLHSDGRAVRRADGTLAGSATLLDGCLRNLRAWLPWLPPAQLVRMASQTPAEALGPAVAARKGRVAPGYDADLVILDRDWRVRTVFVRGERYG
jgi:N-acetylglucosamine-6-phosphate deacetylase